MEKAMINIAIVDEYVLLREALKEQLKKHDDLQVVAEGGNGFEAIEVIKNHPVDVLILEPIIPGKEGIDVTKEIANLKKATKILILTMDRTAHNAFRMLRAGATSWLSKTAGIDEVIKAIRATQRGQVYLPGELQRNFAERYVHPESMNHPEELLSDREYQVMRLLAMGHTNREISKVLFVGVKTVDTHRANLLRKLGLRNNADLTRFAIRNGVIRF